MDVRLCITTMNRPAELVKAVEAAFGSDIELADVVVIDNSTEHYAAQVLQPREDDRLSIITLPHNAGLGPALNLAFALYDDYLICQNDDVAVHPHAIRELVEHAEQFPSYKLLYGNHDDESMFSLFLLRKQAYLEVGGWDPAIWPIYYDDIDVLYKLRLLGYEPVTIHAATYDHVKNGTIKAFDAARKELHDRQFARNEALYQLKWGGLKFNERFTLPFNGGRAVVPPLIKE